LSQPRFEVVFAFLLKLFPEILTTSTIMPSEKFIDYEIKYATELKHYTVYNPETTPHIRKPFSSEETEPLQDIFKILRAGVQKIQRVHAKNYIDYLKKFAAEIQAIGEDKMDKAIKKLKKDHPNQQDLITPPLIGIMQKRNEFLSKFSKV
jgi:acetoin utilization deacetylase AcuC-like enzyme